MSDKRSYIVESDSDIEDFESTVSELMRDGYVPQGGVCVVSYKWTDPREGYEKESTMYFQAMVLKC